MDRMGGAMKIETVPPEPVKPLVQVTMSWYESEGLRQELFEFRYQHGRYPKLVELLDALRVVHKLPKFEHRS